MTLQELEQLKRGILSERCLDQNRKSPRVTVGMGTCGLRAGAAAVLEALADELKKSPAGRAGAVVTHVGCLGLCSYEPIVEVALPGRPPVLYGRLTPEKARQVAREHIVGGKPVEEWVLPVAAG